MSLHCPGPGEAGLSLGAAFPCPKPGELGRFGPAALSEQLQESWGPFSRVTLVHLHLPSCSLPSPSLSLGSGWLSFRQGWKVSSPPRRRRFLLSRALESHELDAQFPAWPFLSETQVWCQDTPVQPPCPSASSRDPWSSQLCPRTTLPSQAK